MNVVFLDDCAADGCYNKNLSDGKQMCKKHQEMYEKGIPFKAFYGREVLKKEFQQKNSTNDNNDNLRNQFYK